MAHPLPPQPAALPLHLNLILSGWLGLNAVSRLPKAVSDSWSEQLATQPFPSASAPVSKLLASLLGRSATGAGGGKRSAKTGR